MRMGSLIVGGMIGAAVALYMKRNNQTMMQTLSTFGQFVNTMLNTGAQNQSAQNQGAQDQGASQQSSFSFNSDDKSSSFQMQ